MNADAGLSIRTSRGIVASAEATETDRRRADSDRRQTERTTAVMTPATLALALQQRDANEAALIAAICAPLGYDCGRPVAAVLIFRFVLDFIPNGFGISDLRGDHAATACARLRISACVQADGRMPHHAQTDGMRSAALPSARTTTAYIAPGVQVLLPLGAL